MKSSALVSISASFSPAPIQTLSNAACRIFQVISDGKLPLRDDFNIENYVNDPRTTPEDQLITEILFSST
jgi:hypothetical protein